MAFRIKDDMKDKVLSEYLFFHFNRAEWDREACYRSWGSSTEVFTWEALCEMELDLPPLPVHGGPRGRPRHGRQIGTAHV